LAPSLWQENVRRHRVPSSIKVMSMTPNHIRDPLLRLTLTHCQSTRLRLTRTSVQSRTSDTSLTPLQPPAHIRRTVRGAGLTLLGRGVRTGLSIMLPDQWRVLLGFRQSTRGMLCPIRSWCLTDCQRTCTLPWGKRSRHHWTRRWLSRIIWISHAGMRSRREPIGHISSGPSSAFYEARLESFIAYRPSLTAGGLLQP
jgi:hypothetical protein